jgi:hypothetical protein
LNKELKPVYENGLWRIDNEFIKADRLESFKELNEAIRHIEAKTLAANNAIAGGLYAADIMLRLPEYRLPRLNLYSRNGLITPERAWKIARDTWINLDKVYPYRDGWLAFFAAMMPTRDLFMTPKELEHLAMLPDEIKIYRGYDRALSRAGISWSMSKMIASQYAKRFKSKKLAQGLVKKADVVGYITARGHHEIVLRSELAVLNQRAVNTVRGDEAMRWLMLGDGQFL